MGTKMIQELLREYEKKRLKKEREVEEKKEKLFLKFPELKSLDIKEKETAVKNIKLIFNDPKNKNKNIKKLEASLKQLNEEKEKLFKKYKIPKDYLSIKYDCDICKDTGKIKGKNNTLQNCNCLKQRIINSNYNKSNLNMLESENFDTFSLKYYSNDISKEKYNSDISPRENMKQILKLAKDFAFNFEKSKGMNLMFSGNTGLRKNIFN